MSKKKIKKRRSISREELFPKKGRKEELRLAAIESILKEKFPDREERKKYIQSILDALENEEYHEIQDEKTYS
jgi:hypothetical protein